jgi:hypothetical protein
MGNLLTGGSVEFDPCRYCAGMGYCEGRAGETTCPECLGTGADQDPAPIRYLRHMLRSDWYAVLGALREHKRLHGARK